MVFRNIAASPLQIEPGRIDNFGICASTLCVVHCALTPVLLVALPLAGLAFLENELVDRSLAVLAILFGIMALNPGYRLHGDIRLLAMAAIGMTCLLIAAFVAEHFWGETGDTVFTAIGGTTLVVSHWLNRSFCKSCLRCQDQQECCQD